MIETLDSRFYMNYFILYFSNFQIIDIIDMYTREIFNALSFILKSKLLVNDVDIK